MSRQNLPLATRKLPCVWEECRLADCISGALLLVFGLQRPMHSHWRSYDANQPKCRADRPIPTTEATASTGGPRCNPRTARSWNSVIRSTRLPNCAGRADLITEMIGTRRHLDPGPWQPSRCCLPLGCWFKGSQFSGRRSADRVGIARPGDRNIGYSMVNLLIFNTFLGQYT